MLKQLNPAAQVHSSSAVLTTGMASVCRTSYTPNRALPRFRERGLAALLKASHDMGSTGVLDPKLPGHGALVPTLGFPRILNTPQPCAAAAHAGLGPEFFKAGTWSCPAHWITRSTCPLTSAHGAHALCGTYAT